MKNTFFIFVLLSALLGTCLEHKLAHARPQAARPHPSGRVAQRGSIPQVGNAIRGIHVFAMSQGIEALTCNTDARTRRPQVSLRSRH